MGNAPSIARLNKTPVCRGVSRARLLAFVIFSGIAIVSSGCAFDVIHVKQTPAHFEPVTADQAWVLRDDLKVLIASGWATPLKKGTIWKRVGRIAEGDVIATRDQILTVEASNVFEAQPVINQGKVVGFFLPVEKSFTPADPPVAITLSPSG